MTKFQNGENKSYFVKYFKFFVYDRFIGNGKS